MAPGEPFHYTFLDQNFQSVYKTEAKMSKVFGLFAGLAIMIACLGLFALTAYTAEQRTKEIGIRKVMGASCSSYHSASFQGIWEADCLEFCTGYTVGRILHSVVSTRLCVQNRNQLVDLCRCRNDFVCFGNVNDGVSIDRGCKNKSRWKR